MDISNWVKAAASVASIIAILVSILPILLKVLKAWMSRRESLSLLITRGDGSEISIEGKSLDEKAVKELIDALLEPSDKRRHP